MFVFLAISEAVAYNCDPVWGWPDSSSLLASCLENLDMSVSLRAVIKVPGNFTLPGGWSPRWVHLWD